MNHRAEPSATAIAAGFHARFGSQPRLFRAPSRVNMIGEYTDFNDGFVLPVAMALYSWVAIAPRLDRIVRAYSAKDSALPDRDTDLILRVTLFYNYR